MWPQAVASNSPLFRFLAFLFAGLALRICAVAAGLRQLAQRWAAMCSCPKVALSAPAKAVLFEKFAAVSKDLRFTPFLTKKGTNAPGFTKWLSVIAWE